jgi:predicted lipoprotein with Yx(FWY)xxD motif
MKWIVPAAVSLMLVGSAGAQARVSSSASSGTVVKVVFRKQLEMPIVVAARGRTVYLLTSDTKGLPTCAQIDPACPKTWPAVTSRGAPVAGAGINGRLLGVVRGAGGSRQVTYNHHPLYYYAGDGPVGDVNGQACFGLWYVLSGKGAAIRKRGPRC